MPRARRGVALVPVVVLTAALLFVGVAFAGHVLQGMRAARLGWQGERAMHAADATLLETLATWSRAEAASRRVGETDTLLRHDGADESMGVRRIRLSARRFLVEAWSTVRDGGVRAARRTAGRAVRLDWPAPPVRAVLTALGPVTLRAGTVILGADAEPAGWAAECALDRRHHPMPAVVATDVSRSDSAVVSGQDPALRRADAESRARDAATFDHAFAALAAVASRTTTDSVLSLDDREALAPACPRWFGAASRGGAVAEACTRRWPIVHAQGAVHLGGTTAGQGVLLVERDLHLAPGTRLSGLVLVRGRVTMEAPSPAGAAEVSGALVVRDLASTGSSFAHARLHASQCAVRLALAGAAQAVPVARHGWHERP